jgi:AraC family transcriptional regulator of adaptative response/methylated-DNA-[protein]-cysteine methyltransferase
VAQACRLIEESEAPPPLVELADAAGLSPGYFHRLFKAVTGLTPRDFAEARKAERVRERLAQGQSVTATIYDAGFNSSGRFYEKAKDMLGMTPGKYRSGGVDEDIRFAVGQSSLGAILVASSDKGVAAILMGEDPEALVRDLQDRFPRARLIGGDADYERLVAQVVGYIEAPCRSIFGGPPSSSGCGGRCGIFHTARRSATPRSPARSARPRRCGRWPGPAPPTTSPSPSRATGWSATTARCPATPGGSIASAP